MQYMIFLFTQRHGILKESRLTAQDFCYWLIPRVIGISLHFSRQTSNRESPNPSFFPSRHKSTTAAGAASIYSHRLMTEHGIKPYYNRDTWRKRNQLSSNCWHFKICSLPTPDSNHLFIQTSAFSSWHLRLLTNLSGNETPSSCIRNNFCDKLGGHVGTDSQCLSSDPHWCWVFTK